MKQSSPGAIHLALAGIRRTHRTQLDERLEVAYYLRTLPGLSKQS